jgi:hypothetical protein
VDEIAEQKRAGIDMVIDAGGMSKAAGSLRTLDKYLEQLRKRTEQLRKGTELLGKLTLTLFDKVDAKMDRLFRRLDALSRKRVRIGIALSDCLCVPIANIRKKLDMLASASCEVKLKAKFEADIKALERIKSMAETTVKAALDVKAKIELDEKVLKRIKSVIEATVKVAVDVKARLDLVAAVRIAGGRQDGGGADGKGSPDGDKKDILTEGLEFFKETLKDVAKDLLKQIIMPSNTPSNPPSVIVKCICECKCKDKVRGPDPKQAQAQAMPVPKAEKLPDVVGFPLPQTAKPRLPEIPRLPEGPELPDIKRLPGKTRLPQPPEVDTPAEIKRLPPSKPAAGPGSDVPKSSGKVVAFPGTAAAKRASETSRPARELPSAAIVAGPVGGVGSWAKRAFKAAGKIARPLGVIADVADIASTRPGKERNKAIGRTVGSIAGGAIGSAIGSFVLPGIGTAALGMAGSAAGEWVGEKIGGAVNKIKGFMSFGKKKKKTGAAAKSESKVIPLPSRSETATAPGLDESGKASSPGGFVRNRAGPRRSNLFTRLFGRGGQQAPLPLAATVGGLIQGAAGLFKGRNAAVGTAARSLAGRAAGGAALPGIGALALGAAGGLSGDLITGLFGKLASLFRKENEPAALPAPRSRSLAPQPSPAFGVGMAPAAAAGAAAGARPVIQQPAPINISVAAGAVQLTVKEQELDYNAIAAQITAKLSASIQQSLENRV